ncbi:MAG TPA: hypothetical protein VKA49_16140 [Flavitalea sp.]|nr:hypothetical protein [Flavitalea sp.]
MLRQLSISVFFIRLIAAIYGGSASPGVPDLNQPETVAIISKEMNEVFSVDSLSIQNNLLHANLNNVLKIVLTTPEGKVAAIADTFSSVYTNWVWKIQEGVLPKNIIGQTRLDGDAVITIFDYAKLRHATDLFVASNILHEMMHAYLTLYYRCDPLAARKDYPKIQIAWQKRTAFNYNDAQHDEIERRFTGDIATALKAYSERVNLIVENTVFSDLAWGGLNFRNNDMLSDEEKERIHNRLLAELFNKQAGDEKPAGVSIAARR